MPCQILDDLDNAPTIPSTHIPSPKKLTTQDQSHEKRDCQQLRGPNGKWQAKQQGHSKQSFPQPRSSRGQFGTKKRILCDVEEEEEPVKKSIKKEHQKRHPKDGYGSDDPLDLLN